MKNLLKYASLASIFLLLMSSLLSSFQYTTDASSHESSSFSIQAIEQNEETITWQIAMESTDNASGYLAFSEGMVHHKVHPSDTTHIEPNGDGYQFSTAEGQRASMFKVTTRITEPDLIHFQMNGEVNFDGHRFTAFDEIAIIPDQSISVEVNQEFKQVPDGMALPDATVQLVKNGDVDETVVLTNGQESYTFQHLPKYHMDGSLNEYQVTASELEGFLTEQHENRFVHTFETEPEEKQPLNEDVENKDTDNEDQSPKSSTTEVAVMSIDTSGEYEVDEGGAALFVELEGMSTNSHSMPEALWSKDGTIYVAVKTTHGAEELTLDGVTSTNKDEYNAWVPVSVNGEELNLDGLQGNTNASHWAVFKFNLNDFNWTDGGSVDFEMISKAGRGHDLEAAFTVVVPTIDVTAEKKWIGGPAERPSVELEIYRKMINGPNELLDTQTVNGTENHAWTMTLTDQLEFDPYGRGYIYTADEVEVPAYYEKSLNGLLVENTFNPGELSISVNKEWIGPKASEAVFELLANDQVIDSLTLTADEDWSGRFDGFPVIDENTGEPIEYDVQEVDVDRSIYHVYKSGSAEEGFVFTNTNESTTDLSVKKIWDGLVGDEIEVQLLRDGEPYLEPVALNEANDWFEVFENLRKFDANTGDPYQYTVEEVDVPAGYEVDYSYNDDGEAIITNHALIGGVITAKYVDEDGNELAQPEVFSGLIGATYETQQKEIEGYELVEIDGEESGTFIEKPITVTYMYSKILGSISLTKVDAENDDILLEDATFHLLDQDGKLVSEQTTDETGSIVFDELELGQYELKEVAAPPGYRLSDKSVTVTVTAEERDKSVPFENTLIGWEIPDTGGIGTLGFYMMGAFLMVVPLILLVRKRRMN